MVNNMESINTSGDNDLSYIEVNAVNIGVQATPDATTLLDNNIELTKEEKEKRQENIEILSDILEIKQDVIRKAYLYYSTIKHKEVKDTNNYITDLKKSYDKINSLSKAIT
jgi:thymidylate kinase